MQSNSFCHLAICWCTVKCVCVCVCVCNLYMYKQTIAHVVIRYVSQLVVCWCTVLINLVAMSKALLIQCGLMFMTKEQNHTVLWTKLYYITGTHNQACCLLCNIIIQTNHILIVTGLVTVALHTVCRIEEGFLSVRFHLSNLICQIELWSRHALCLNITRICSHRGSFQFTHCVSKPTPYAVLGTSTS